MKKLLLAAALLTATSMQAQTERIKYGDFESWVTRSIKESFIVGGNRQTLYEIGPNVKYDGARAYKNQGGSPWATSNVLAKVAGVVTTNLTVEPDEHKGGRCVKMTTRLVQCKAAGVINVTVLAGGSIFLGEMMEPITGSTDPMAKMSLGMPLTKRPKAVKFDYKYLTPGDTKRIRETGFSKRAEVNGPDMAECTCLLQKRWEDKDGAIHALRVGTMKVRFNKNTQGWVEGSEFPIRYGDITKDSSFQNCMDLCKGDNAYYTLNSKGKNVMIHEDGWADASETPTHIILKFDSSYGDAYEGAVGNTLWIDNVALVY